MLARIAGFSARHRRLVLVIWLVVVASVVVARNQAGGHFANDLSVPGTDSDRAYQVLHDRFPSQSGDALQIVIRTKSGIAAPPVAAKVNGALRQIAKVPDVDWVSSPYAPRGMVSADGTTGVALVQFADRARDIPSSSIDAVENDAAPIRGAGAQVEFGGAALQTQEHPSGGDVAGLAAAVVVLLFAFGSVFAMLVPLLSALLSLALGLSIVGLLASVTSIGTAGPVVAAMVGLGVGIDYALLIVTRHREIMAAGQPPEQSIPLALSTAGRSVLVAGSTVVFAILGLYLMGIPFVATLGLATAVTVSTTLLSAVTLLPALLGFFGARLDRLRVRKIRFDHVAGQQAGGKPSGWHRWVRHVQRLPIVYLLAAVAVLVALALPMFSMRLGTADAGSNPTSDTSRRAYDIVAAEFGPGYTGPLIVTAEFPPTTSPATVSAQTQQLRQALVAAKDVVAVTPPQVNPAGDTAVMSVVPKGAPQDASTSTLVRTLRDTVIPQATTGDHVRARVGGETAMATDLADRISARMPWFIGAVVAVSVLLLLMEFRSVFLPFKAAALNLLSTGAAYGAVVAAYQWGWLPGAQTGPIESFAPVMLFAVLFGLSMDYEVFLLSRVREEYLSTRDATRSVADGIAATARVITAAASVMVVVFASFMFNDQRVVNLFGFGLAVAIALDATIVRLMLVPAAITLAGRGAWWLPRWIDRILPAVGAQGVVKSRQLDRRIERMGGLMIRRVGSHRRYVLAHPNGQGQPTALATTVRQASGGIPAGVLHAIESDLALAPGGGTAALNGHSYRVVVTREDGHWLADVPGLQGAHTYERTLPALDHAVREVIVLAADLPEEAMPKLTLDHDYHTGDPDADSLAADARSLRQQADELAAAARARGREAAVRLLERGAPTRDVAAMLGISTQQVSRLTSKKH